MEQNKYFWDKHRTAGSTSTSSFSTPATEEVRRMVQNYNSKFSLYDELINTLTNQLTKSTKEIETLKNNYSKLENEAKATYKEFKQETQTDKSKLIEVVGIFVAIFTFISVEVQILESVNGILRIAGFTILLFALLMLFLFLLNYMADNWINKHDNFLPQIKHPFFLYVMILVIISLVLIGFGDYKNPAEIKNNKEYIELKEQVDMLEIDKASVEEKLESIEQKNNELNNKIVELENSTLSD